MFVAQLAVVPARGMDQGESSVFVVIEEFVDKLDDELESRRDLECGKIQPDLTFCFKMGSNEVITSGGVTFSIDLNIKEGVDVVDKSLSTGMKVGDPRSIDVAGSFDKRVGGVAEPLEVVVDLFVVGSPDRIRFRLCDMLLCDEELEDLESILF